MKEGKRGQTQKIKISPCSRDYRGHSGPAPVHPKTKVSGYVAAFVEMRMERRPAPKFQRFKNGGGGGGRTRVRHSFHFKSFTGLFSFSKLTKFPLVNPLIHGLRFEHYFISVMLLHLA